MPVSEPIRPFRIASLAWVTCLLLAIPVRPQSFAQRVHRVAAPPADSGNAFCAVTRWQGRLFVLYDAACFWSLDPPGASGAGEGNRTWIRQDLLRTGPKGMIPAIPGGWFTRSRNGLWLSNREGALAWRFDTTSGTWAPWPSGEGAMAAAGDGDRVYALAPDHVFRSTRNAGVTWEEIPLPAAVKVGTFFDDILAEGDHLVLRAHDPAMAPSAARSFDGGATWAFLPSHALSLLAHGRLYAFKDSVLTLHRPGAESLALPAPPARAAFADSAGLLFAWSDSGLYVIDAAAIGDAGPPAPHAQVAWSLLADPDALRGWSSGRDVLYRWAGGYLEWFDGLPVSADPVRRKPPSPSAHVKPGYRFDPTDPGGFSLDFRGFRWDPVGRSVPGPQPH